MGDDRPQPFDEVWLVHVDKRRDAKDVASHREAKQLRSHQSSAFGGAIGDNCGQGRRHPVDEDIERLLLPVVRPTPALQLATTRQQPGGQLPRNAAMASSRAASR